ncbi:MAG TPA: hypothetical protein VFC18_05775 [Burkholderiales bacterium]|nr:hypothetical protein [Burkholderiales bacterium]
METSTKRKWALRAAVLGAGTVIALVTFSGPSESTLAAQRAAPEAPATATAPTSDPSLFGLSISADAQPGDVEIFY